VLGKTYDEAVKDIALPKYQSSPNYNVQRHPGSAHLTF